MDWDARKAEICGPASLAMIPWNDDFSPDLGALEDNIRWMVDGGLVTGRGFVISPSGTGELVHLNKEEHRRIVEASVKGADGKIPVVAGVGSCSVFEAIEMTRNAHEAGAGHVMLTPPFYYRLDDDSFYTFISMVAEAVPGMAIMLYDQPWRGHLATSLTTTLLQRVADIPNVLSLKFGGPGIYVQMISTIPMLKDRYAFIDNSLGFTSSVGHMHGSASFISGPASWWPEFELEYWDLLEQGTYGEADRMHAKLAPYMHFFMGEEFTTGEPYPYYFGASIVKGSLDYVGLKGGAVRPPFSALGDDDKKVLFRILDDIPYNGRRV